MPGISFRRDGQNRIYILNPWPKDTNISDELISGDKEYLVENGSFITIRVKNGFATYRKICRSNNGWHCLISENEFIA